MFAVQWRQAFNNGGTLHREPVLGSVSGAPTHESRSQSLCVSSSRPGRGSDPKNEASALRSTGIEKALVARFEPGTCGWQGHRCDFSEPKELAFKSFSRLSLQELIESQGFSCQLLLRCRFVRKSPASSKA